MQNSVQPLNKKFLQGAPMFLSSLTNNVLGWLINCFMVFKNHFNPTSAIKTTGHSLESRVDPLDYTASKIRKNKSSQCGPYGSYKIERAQVALFSKEPSPLLLWKLFLSLIQKEYRQKGETMVTTKFQHRHTCHKNTGGLK